MDQATIKATDNGPLLVKGTFTILDGEGTEYSIERATVALCRCGRSRRKPFCDGTHAKIGFASRPRATADEEAGAKSA
jgi:CDGSH-type Zn-finger protein